MSDSKTPSRNDTAQSWDSYWRGDTSSHAYSSSGVNHVAVTAYWKSLFNEMKDDGAAKTMVDIASGNGALPELALSIFDTNTLNITAVDVSASAIENITRRFPDVIGVVADANELDLDENKYDIVTSQFGIEYAGSSAVDKAIDLVKPDGLLAFMLHAKGGKIEDECQANKEALFKLVEINFLVLAHKMFEHGFAAVAGADRSAYDEAATELNSVLPVVEGLIEIYGEDVAGGLIVQLYADVGKIHSRMPHYNAEDILPWLDAMNSEVKAYLERMQSMLDAALDQQKFDVICNKLESASFSLQDHTALIDQQTSLPLAWIIRANKTL